MDTYDIVVVGGGIHGTGVAQAAAAAGYSVLVLEKSGLADGTSSKSSKLIHGGLRYLESYEFNLVAECLRERAILLKIAPGLVQLKPFLIPVFKSTRRHPLLIRTGLSLYAILGRFSRGTAFRTVPRSDWDELDGLRTDELRAVFCYHDAQTDDRLLTQAVMRSAASLGAELRVPAKLTAARRDRDGIEIEFKAAQVVKTCRASVLVNAAGPWVNDVLRLVVPAPEQQAVTLVQGSHLVVSQRFERGIYYVESPRDGRAVFIMPRDTDTLIGTTEVRFRGDPDQVRVFPHERNYLLSVVGHYFPGLQGKLDVKDAWAGLRVLPAGDGHAFHRSRETILQFDDNHDPRVLSIYGGKLTAYRATAEKVVRKLKPFLPQRKPVADTATLALSDG